jgi:hypothetical protein
VKILPALARLLMDGATGLTDIAYLDILGDLKTADNTFFIWSCWILLAKAKRTVEFAAVD